MIDEGSLIIGIVIGLAFVFLMLIIANPGLINAERLCDSHGMVLVQYEPGEEIICEIVPENNKNRVVYKYNQN